MVKYQRITLLEREEISRNIASGCSIQEIAQSLTILTSGYQERLGIFCQANSHFKV